MKIAIVLFSQVAHSEAINVNVSECYQTDSGFSMSGDAKVRQMVFSGTLGRLVVSAQVLDQSDYNRTQELIVQDGTSVSFSYEDIHELVGVPEEFWHIVPDGAQKISPLDFGNKIEMGGILVQKSIDGSTWKNTYQKCNAFTQR